MFLGLFPISFYWLRTAWRIGVKKDFSRVALKRGASPDSPGKYAGCAAGINLAAGAVLTFVIGLIIFSGLEFESWTAAAGITIWMKFFAEFILSRHAHMKWKK